MLYNVPSRTNSKLEIESIKYLSRNENIVGIKDASGDLNFVKEIINNTNKNEFVVLSGEDNIVSNVMKLGGRGVISASANVAPRYFVNITNAALSSKFDIADTLQKEVNGQSSRNSAQNASDKGNASGHEGNGACCCF